MEKLFKTDNLSLAPFLFLKGLKFVGVETGIGKGNKKRVFFVFEDPHGAGIELEKSFINSPEKKFKDALHYFRNQIKLHQTIKRD